jgi:hypothetical protein
MHKPITMLVAAACGLVVSAGLAATALAAPAGYHIVKGPALPAPPGPLDSGSQVACPTGTVPWGGGIAGNAFIQNMTINTTASTSNGWEGRVNNPDGQGGVFEIDAICAKKPSAYTAVYASVDNPPGARSVATAVCPVNTVVLSGGGFSTADEIGARMLGAWPTSTRAFRAVELNATASDAQLSAEALCAAKPRGYVIARSSLVENPGTLDFGGQSCPAAKTEIGGGIHITGGDSTALIHSSIDNEAGGWANDTTTGAVPLTLAFSAICVS